MGELLCFPMERAARHPPGAWVQHPDYAGEAQVMACDGPRRRIRLMAHFPDERPDVEALPPAEAQEVVWSETILAFEIEVAAASLRALSPCRDVGRLPPDWQACTAFFHDEECDARTAARLRGAARRLYLAADEGHRHLDTSPPS